jgi:two-component system, cell cycle sensor histidine kinase and response regulator CckA
LEFILAIGGPPPSSASGRAPDPALGIESGRLASALGIPVIACTNVDAALESIRVQDAHGATARVVLIGPDHDGAIRTANRLRPETPLAHFAFLMREADPSFVQRLTSPVARFGRYWSTIDLGGSDPVAALREAAERAEKRLHLRRSLLRINTQLASAGTFEAVDARRHGVSHRFLASILANARDGIVATDEDGCILTWNGAAERMFGVPERDVVGEPLDRVIRGNWAYALDETLARLRTSPSGSVRMELACDTEGGRGVLVDLVLSVVRDTGDDVIGASAIMRDVTESRALEERVRRTQALESLGVLAGGIAHDFNNILTGILGNAELALLGLEAGSKANRRVQDVRQSALRAAELCRQILAYGGGGKYVVETVDLNAIVGEMPGLLYASVPRKADVRYELRPEPVPIEADAGQIRQVVMNLILNASESLGGGHGMVTVHTAVVPCDERTFAGAVLQSELPPGPYARLTIADTGRGMSRETIDRIFEPFFTTKFTGRGLGLAAVLGIVRSHRGAITVQSSEGHGTTFTIHLPCASDAVLPAGGKAAEAAPGRIRGRILVIDDEEVVRSVIRETLEGAGANVDTAPDGQQGLARFGELADELALVLLDLTMPKMGGDDVLAKIRERREDLPVVIMSGYTEQEVTRRIGAAGVTAFLQKPFVPGALRELVARILGTGAAGRGGAV